MIGLASVLPFSFLAQRRASALQESILPCSSRDLTISAGFLIIALVSATEFSTIAGGLGVALLFVHAWTDLRLRRVYLPVTLAAALELAILGVLHQLPSDAALGAGGLGLFSLSLWLLAARSGGWAGGDVIVFVLVGAAFGFRVGLALAAITFVGGALICGLCIAARLFRRDEKIPMAALMYAAVPAYLLLSHLCASWVII